MLIVTGDFVAKPECLSDAIQLSLEHVNRSRGEDGCLMHSVYQDVENYLRLVFVEHWSSKETLAAHFSLPASQQFVKAIRALADALPALSIYEAERVIMV